MSRWKPTLIAFFLHAPGLRFLTGYALPRRVKILNAFAVGITFSAMMYFSWDFERMILAWLCGHFLWGAYLAFSVFRAYRA